MFLEKEEKGSAKMISIRARSCPYRKSSSVAPPDFFLPPESEFSKQPAGPTELKSFAAATNVYKYSKDDL